MKNFAEKVYNSEFETSANGELKQNVRNEFKRELMKNFAEFMKANGMDVETVSSGVAVQFANKELGSICVVFDGTVKDREFDIVSEAEAHAEKVIEKAKKEAEKAEIKAKKIAESERVRAEKALKEKKETK